VEGRTRKWRVWRGVEGHSIRRFLGELFWRLRSIPSTPSIPSTLSVLKEKNNNIYFLKGKREGRDGKAIKNGEENRSGGLER
jgi:hypothetical protein